MRISRDPHICSTFQLHYLGEPIAESHSYEPPYSSDGPLAETLDGFKAECRKAVKKFDDACGEVYQSPRCGSFIFATAIEHQQFAAKFLLELGFTGTGWITFGKYIHKMQFFTMPMPLFIPAIGLEYFTRDGLNENDSYY